MSTHQSDELEVDYQSAGFGQHLEPGNRPALLLVDLVRAYFDPGAEFYLGSATTCLQSAVRLLAAARKHGLLVVHTRVSYTAGGLDGGVFFRKVGGLRHFVDNGPLGEQMPEVAARDGEVVVVKQYASAFFGTSLASMLSAQAIDTVIIAGVSTSGCIRATAVDAAQNGYIPLVVRDAVGDRDPRPHEASLFDLQAKYAEVVTEQDAISCMQVRR